MNTVLWVVQGLLGVVFLMTGLLKALLHPKAVEGPLKDLPKGLIRVIGICELLGVAGVLLPEATGIFPILTPLAAVGLATVMVLAMFRHLKKKEVAETLFCLVLFWMAAFVVYGRLNFSA